MSRAFVKENDLEHAGTDIAERPISPHPNYVTPTGLRQLQDAMQSLELERLTLSPKKDDPVARQRLAVINRELRYYAARLENAALVNPATQPANEVRFGATVTVEDENGEIHIFAIVGEDETDIGQNKVSWVSPLASALIGAKIGDVVKWRRPAGDMDLEITKIRYL